MDKQTKTHLARKLRRGDTKAEQVFWYAVRRRSLGGYKFRRQTPIDTYIADFVCESAKLIVELDGSQHADMQDADAVRSAKLEEYGYRILRYWNDEIYENLDAVLDEVLRALEVGKT